MDLRSIKWGELQTAYGSAEDVPDMLERLLTANTSEAVELLFYLDGVVFHQGTFYTSSPYVIRYLLELIENPSLTFRARLLDFLARHAKAISFQQNNDSLKQDYLEIFMQCKGELEKYIDRLIAFLSHSNPYFRMTATSILVSLSSPADKLLYKRFLSQLPQEDHGHVQASLLFALSEVTPKSVDITAELEPYFNSSHDIVRYATVYTIWKLTDTVPERFASFLADILNNFPHFIRLWDTPADAEDNAYHPIASTLSEEPVTPPDELIDTASFPWSDRGSKFEVIELLTQIENQDNPHIKEAYIHLLLTDSSYLFRGVSQPILRTILQQTQQEKFDADNLSADHRTYLRAIYDNIFIWANFDANAPTYIFTMLGLPSTRQGWTKFLKLDEPLPPSQEQAEEILERLTRESLYIRDASRPLTQADYERVKQLGLMHIGHDLMIEHLHRYTNIRRLYIGFSQFTANGIARFPAFEQLEEIRLVGIILNEGAMQYLTTLENLKSLSMSDTQFKREWIHYLVAIKTLTDLIVGGDGWTDDDKAMLQEHLPDCRIYIRSTSF